LFVNKVGDGWSVSRLKREDMKRFFRASLVLMVKVSLAFAVRSAAVEPLPSASNLLQRVVARAETTARAGETNHYAYDKRSITEELDEDERVTKSTEKLYRVELIGGLTFPRLVKVQGKELSAKQLEKENEREAAFRQRVTRVDMNKKARRKEALATPELIERFEFRVTKREVVAGRATLVMTFAPRVGAPDKTMEDKIFGKVFGTVWVDEAEAEVTKLDASVRGPVPLGWFGAVGSLHKFQAAIERSRMPDGVWVNRKSSFWVVARKLLSTIRTRMVEESSGFRRE
jgi:hypothetical protein